MCSCPCCVVSLNCDSINSVIPSQIPSELPVWTLQIKLSLELKERRWTDALLCVSVALLAVVLLYLYDYHKGNVRSHSRWVQPVTGRYSHTFFTCVLRGRAEPVSLDALQTSQIWVSKYSAPQTAAPKHIWTCQKICERSSNTLFKQSIWQKWSVDGTWWTTPMVPLIREKTKQHQR